MKDKILTIIFVSFLSFFFIIGFFIKDKDISYTERRKYSLFPETNFDNILSGKWMDEFDSYVLDQFVFREEFRNIKALSQKYLFMKKENNGFFIKDDVIYQTEYPLNERSINSFVYKMNTLYNTYLKDMNVYYTIVPDKNYYLDNNYLKMDYDKLFSIIKDNMNEKMQYIDITNLLTINDYYLTDTHWKQNKIGEVVKKLSSIMNFKIDENYEVKSYYPFYGVYYGQAALKTKADTIYYLYNDAIKNAVVEDIDSELSEVYEEDSLGKLDSYDVFLSGTTPLITIDNPLLKEGKELIIFRDSFASTIAPLLINGYKKITLVDLRYIDPNKLNEIIKFDKQDILIIYNTIMINNSEAIRV